MGKDTQKTVGRAGGRRGSGDSRGNLTSREFSAGGVVFKRDNDNVLWLVTRSTPSDLFPKAVWRLPKGHIESNESTEQTAIREVGEESGIEAKIIKKIETVKYFFTISGEGNIFKFVTFYLMEYVSDLSKGHDMETSEISWLSYEEAYKKLSYGREKQMLKKARELLLTN